MKGFKNILKTVTASALTIALCASMAGCGNTGGKKTADVALTTDGKYPMDTDVSLRIWQRFTPTNQLLSMNDTEFKKYLEEATGVKITYEHPPTGSSEAFDLMISSNDMPDIIVNGWRSPDNVYKMDEYVESGAVLDLTPYIEGGAMPNLKKIMDENEGFPEMTKSYNGKYMYAPMILGDDILRSYRGFVIRQDLLDKAGLEVPETLDEWETALHAFKDMGVKIPISITLDYWAVEEGRFTNPFDFIGDFYLDGNTVKYGVAEPAMKDYIATLKRWFDEGLLDANFTDDTSSRISQIITSGDCGAFYCNVGGGLGTYMNAVKKDSGIRFTPAKIPVKNKGDKAEFGQTQYRVHTVGAAISADCKNPEIAARFLDFGYSEEGQKIWNFGKEGVSYTMAKDENGEEYPKYTDLITDPAKRGEGVSLSQALMKYASVGNPISVQNKWYLLQVNSSPEQRKMLEYVNDNNMDAHLLPPVLLNKEENKNVSELLTPLQTYVEETMVKIVAGKMDFESGMKEYYDTLAKLKVQDIISIYQGAYDRYLEKNK